MNIDIRLSVGFWHHPKTKKTAKRLGLEGIRSLQVLWLWAAVNRPDGALSGMDWEDIELAADWHGEEKAFFDCCVSGEEFSMWIDHTEEGFFLHDWVEHNPWQAEAEARSQKARKGAEARWGKKKSKPEHKPSNAPSMPGGCKSNAEAMPEHKPSNAPSPSPKPEELNTPPYPPRGGDVGDEESACAPGKKKKTREPTGNSLPELRTAVEAYTTSEPLRRALEDFRLMRERIRKPMTGRALKLIFLELDKLARSDEEKVALLEQSILNSWQGVFELKARARASPAAPEPSPADVAIFRSREETEAFLHACRQRDGIGQPRQGESL